METKHTPGPWETSRGAQNYPFSIESESKTIAFIKMQTEVRHTTANAKLIAAAPDLLEANISALACLVNLRELLRLDKSENDFSDEVIDCIKELNAAIQKATE